MKRTSLLALVLIFLAAGLPVPVMAEEAVAVNIVAPDSGEPGGSFTAAVAISNVTDLNAAQYDIRYDPAVLELESVSGGAIGQVTIPVPTGAISPQEIEPGYWRVLQSLGMSSATGSGDLCFIHFRILDNAASGCQIDITNGVLSNMDAAAIPATWNGDTIVVSSGGTAAPPAAPPAGDTTGTGLITSPAPPEESLPVDIPEIPSGDIPVETTPPPAGSHGSFTAETTIISADQKAELTIQAGVFARTPDNIPVTQITVKKTALPSAAAAIAGDAYDFGPDGARFDTPVTLTFTYSAADIPAGFDESSLTIAYWNEQTARWITVGSIIDTEKNIITAQIDHFTVFAVLAPGNAPQTTAADTASAVPAAPQESAAIKMAATTSTVSPAVSAPGTPLYRVVILGVAGGALVILIMALIARTGRRHEQ
jgi:hypothetical protein